MKKNYTVKRCVNILLPGKILQIMKLTSVFLFLSLIPISARSYSQEAKVRLHARNYSLEKIFSEIEKQTDYRFLYRIENVKDKYADIKSENLSIKQLLNQIVNGKDIKYTLLENKLIVITPSEAVQTKRISGVITDATTGETLPGVNVVVEGTTSGVNSDINGKFTIDVPGKKDVTLIFSYVGYNVEKVKLDGQTVLNVKLTTSVKSLDEVVVVGYGVQKKESVVGSITQVDNKTLVNSGTTDVTNAIAGKLSGVLTIQQTGEPGASSSEIVVRGLSSWNGSSPLVLVDGVERDFADMDPNEINTISVLKDASATAVYGAKGANGVIIVTSKRGSFGKPKLSVTASTGVEYATNIPKHISSYTTLNMLNVALMNGQQFTDLISQDVLNQYKNPSSPIMALEYPDVNWFKELTNKFAPEVNTNINLQGGTNFVKYFASMGYLYQGDLFKAYHNGYDDSRYKYNRFNYRANLDFALTKTTELSLNVGGEVGVKNTPSNSPWYGLYATSPARFPAYFPAWVLDSIPDLDYPDAKGARLAATFGEYSGNPYTTLNNGSFNKYNESKLFTDLMLEQKLDFITPGLSAKGKISLSTYYQTIDLTASYSFPQYLLDYSKIGTSQNPWSRNGQGNEVYNMAPIDLNVGGLQTNYYKDLYYEMSLNYNRTFGNHYVTALALMNRQEKDQGTDYPYYNEALVGRATYDFKHKYLLEFNMGYTGSERFAPSNRFGFFPAAAVGWVISEEPFFKNTVPWMNKLKVRYSDGLTGSDAAGNRWLYISDYYKDPAGYIREDKGANSSAQWEEARKRDIGTEIGIFNSLFTLSVDLFDEQRDKMLLTPQTVTFLVGSSFKELNKGKLKKHGIEVEAEFNKTTYSKLNYFVRGIFGFNENRVIFKDDPVNTPEYQKNSGKPLGSQASGVSLNGSGYYTSIDDIHNNPAAITLNQLNVGDYRYCDYNADGSITSLDKHPIVGNLYPPITFSLSSGLSYKGWEFSFMFQGNKGKYVDYNQTFECEFIKGDYSVHTSQLDYWTPNNLSANHSTLHYSAGGNTANLVWGGGEAASGYNTKIQDRFWRRADYLRLKEVYLGYNFTSSLMKRLMGVSALNVYATGNNLFTVTSLIEGDPERKDFQQGYYPQLSTIVFGMKLSF